MIRRSSSLRRLLREPLLHFFVIGALIYLLYSVFNDPERNLSETIVITPARIDQLINQFEAVWNRKPGANEVDHLIEEEIRSEVYYRDALALGLDKNDAMVRRRLRQKMEFLSDTSIYLQEPSKEDLERYFSDHKQTYQHESRLAFEQLYLGQTVSQQSAAKMLDTLRATPAMATSSLGQRTSLPAQLGLSRAGAVDSIFGSGFYSQLGALEPGRWDGPVTSSYGLHLVRTLDGQPGRMPELDEVRDTVVREWKAAKAKGNREADYVKRRSRYKVEVIREAEMTRDAAGEKS